MNIACVLDEREVKQPFTDLIVFPEGIPSDQVARIAKKYPSSITIAACIERQRCAGYALHNGQTLLRYVKVLSDGRTDGSGDTNQSPIVEINGCCIGVLICQDIDHVEFSRKIFDGLRNSKAKTKILCIPADMGSEWFSHNVLPKKYHGFHVVLCNHTKTHQFRCRSFITDLLGTKVVVQNTIEPIYWSLS